MWGNLSLFAILSLFGGLLYFGYKASMNGMHWFFIMIWVIFGVGAIVDFGVDLAKTSTLDTDHVP